MWSSMTGARDERPVLRAAQRDFTPIMTIYDQAFSVGDFHYAAALSVILALVVGLVSALFYRLTNRAPI